MKKLVKFISPITLITASLIVPAVVMAQTNIVPNSLIQTNNIVNVVRGIISFVLIIAFVIAFIMLLVGGIRWILAGGDEKAVGSARGTITAALIGLVIVLVAFALIKVIENFFKVAIISNGVTLPTITP